MAPWCQLEIHSLGTTRDMMISYTCFSFIVKLIAGCSLMNITCCCTEGAAGCTVEHELENDVVTRKIEQVFRSKVRREFPRDDRRILRAEPECDQGADVRKHCMPHIGVQLVQVLVRQKKRNPELAQLRHHVHDGTRCKALKFIDIEKKRLTFFFRHIGTTKRGKTDRGQEQCPKQIRAVFAEPSLREIHNQNLPLIHDLADMEIDRRLGQHPVQARIGKECADLVLDRRNCLTLVDIAVLGEFLLPELQDLPIAHML